MKEKIEQAAVNPGQHSVTPPPGSIREPSEETRERVRPEREVLQEALRQIRTPEQARQIVDIALAAAEGKTEEEVSQEEQSENHEETPRTNKVRKAASTLGTDKTAEIIIQASREVAGSTGETREALEEAFQEATNPRQQGKLDPSLEKPVSLLHAELLKRMQPAQSLDARLFLAINHLPHPPLANRLMYWITSVMNGGWGWVFGLVVAALLDKRRGRAALLQVVPPLWFATMSVEYPIKFYFRRRRPFIDVVQAISVGKKPGTYSFPSGHSAASFAGAWLLRRHYPHLTALWYSIAVVVGFSRMYLGAHYPGDVASGALAGTLIAELTRRMIEESDNYEPGGKNSFKKMQGD